MRLLTRKSAEASRATEKPSVLLSSKSTYESKRKEDGETCGSKEDVEQESRLSSHGHGRLQSDVALDLDLDLV